MTLAYRFLGLLASRFECSQVNCCPGSMDCRERGAQAWRAGVQGWVTRAGASGHVPQRPQLTSYSWESLRLSLALSLSMCSAMSEMGMGGWLSIPVEGVARGQQAQLLWPRRHCA